MTHAAPPKEQTLVHRVEDALDPSHPHGKVHQIRACVLELCQVPDVANAQVEKEHAAAHERAETAVEETPKQHSHESKEPTSAGALVLHASMHPCY